MEKNLDAGILAYKSKDKKLAAEIFTNLVRENPRNEKAWLWLAACVVKAEDKIICLRKAISINPNNTEAKVILENLEKKEREQKIPSLDFSAIPTANIYDSSTPVNYHGGNAGILNENNNMPIKKFKKINPGLLVLIIIACIGILAFVVFVVFPQIGPQKDVGSILNTTGTTNPSIEYGSSQTITAFAQTTPTIPLTLYQPPTPRPVQSDLTSQTISLNDLGYLKDETVQGVTVSRTYGIRWPGTWAITSGSSVTIVFSHPQSLASYSTMAVDFNDVRIGSVMFTPENADHGSIQLDIPANIIKTGYNTLTLQFYMGIHDNYCDDLENPGVWATIHNSTSFTFSYEYSAPIPELSVFPYPFLQKSELLVNQITIIVPDNPEPAELDAISILSAKLGQLNSVYNMNIDVLPESSVSNPASVPGNVIYVGLSKNLRIFSSGTYPFIKNADGIIEFISLEGQSLNQDDGVLWEDISPGDPKSVRLIVTGLTEKALEKAARGLANDSVYVRLKGQLGVIEDVPAPLGAAIIKPTLALEDLGYVDETATGTVKQTLNYAFPLPGEWRVATEATLKLNFAHSALLYPQGSVLTVLVNDIPVGSDLLTAENAENGQITYKIPARLFQIGSNLLSVVTNSQLPYDPQDQYFCNKDHYNDAWVTVYSNSTLTLPDGPTSLVLDLKNFPAGFSGADDLSDFAFVVPDSSDWSTAQAIAWIAARLGRYSSSTEFSPNILLGSDNIVDSAISSQILIGEPSNNPAIYKLNSILPLPFSEGTNTLQNPEKIAQIMSPTGSGSIGYIQSALTADGKPRLVVTGNSTEGVLWAAKALNDQVTMDELKGDFAVLDAPGSVYAASISNEAVAPIENAPIPTSETPIQTITGVSTTWVLWLAGGLFLLTVLIIVIFTIFTVRKKK